MSTEGICVCVRARPLNERELRSAAPGKGWLIDPYNNTIQQDVQGKQAMNFDRVFDETADNVQVYTNAAKRVVESGLDGINGTIFAYGQTSSGKTYSMGSIMKMGFQDIFSHIKKDKNRKYVVKASYIEIYNEIITDLLDSNKTNLKVQDSERGPYIPGLTERDGTWLQPPILYLSVYYTFAHVLILSLLCFFFFLFSRLRCGRSRPSRTRLQRETRWCYPHE